MRYHVSAYFAGSLESVLLQFGLYAATVQDIKEAAASVLSSPAIAGDAADSFSQPLLELEDITCEFSTLSFVDRK